ncbi:hypothetical protein M885DRAFT_612842 [Pelagophyceae sp. CCMP2097]|nr:hypothetical protein M885DRAFT_612842 [Pelagophyceae sp. CCMP2097]
MMDVSEAPQVARPDPDRAASPTSSMDVDAAAQNLPLHEATGARPAGGDGALPTRADAIAAVARDEAMASAETAPPAGFPVVPWPAGAGAPAGAPYAEASDEEGSDAGDFDARRLSYAKRRNRGYGGTEAERAARKAATALRLSERRKANREIENAKRKARRHAASARARADKDLGPEAPAEAPAANDAEPIEECAGGDAAPAEVAPTEVAAVEAAASEAVPVTETPAADAAGYSSSDTDPSVSPALRPTDDNAGPTDADKLAFDADKQAAREKRGYGGTPSERAARRAATDLRRADRRRANREEENAKRRARRHLAANRAAAAALVGLRGFAAPSSADESLPSSRAASPAGSRANSAPSRDVHL